MISFFYLLLRNIDWTRLKKHWSEVMMWLLMSLLILSWMIIMREMNIGSRSLNYAILVRLIIILSASTRLSWTMLQRYWKESMLIRLREFFIIWYTSRCFNNVNNCWIKKKFFFFTSRFPVRPQNSQPTAKILDKYYSKLTLGQLRDLAELYQDDFYLFEYSLEQVLGFSVAWIQCARIIQRQKCKMKYSQSNVYSRAIFLVQYSKTNIGVY